MNEAVFRLYDIRGRIGVDFHVEDAYFIGRAIAYYFLQKDPSVKTIAVGIDGRLHSPAIKEHLVRALRESGLDVIFIGLCPTPVLYFTLFNEPVDGGIMITASHNGPGYNGLKLCLRKNLVALEEITRIRDTFRAGIHHLSMRPGRYQEKDMNERYIDYMSTNFAHLIGADISIVLDCGGGATATVIPLLLECMSWKKTILLFSEIDGAFSGHLPDPTDEHNIQDLKRTVHEQQVDVGIAFDGDGDRMVAMTRNGEPVPGDKALALFAHNAMKEQRNFSVIFDVKSSTKLTELLAAWGLTPIMVPTGHAYIKKAMHEHNGLLGGEMSCHFFFADRYFGFDDGIYAFLRLIEIMVSSRKSLDELIAFFPRSYATPEIRIASKEGNQQKVIEAVKNIYALRPDVSISTLDGVRVIFESGWALIRASNTEPVISLRFEAESEQELKSHKQEFAAALAMYIDKDILGEKLGL